MFEDDKNKLMNNILELLISFFLLILKYLLLFYFYCLSLNICLFEYHIYYLNLDILIQNLL